MKKHVTQAFSVNEGTIWDSLTTLNIIKFLLNQWMDRWMDGEAERRVG